MSAILSTFVSFFKLLIELVRLFTLLSISCCVTFSLASNSWTSCIAFSKFSIDVEVFPSRLWALACCKTLSKWALFTLAFFCSWSFSEVSTFSAVSFFSKTGFFSETAFFSETTPSFGTSVTLETVAPPVAVEFGVEASPDVTVDFGSTTLSVAWAGDANANPVAKNKEQPKAINFPFLPCANFFVQYYFYWITFKHLP